MMATRCLLIITCVVAFFSLNKLMLHRETVYDRFFCVLVFRRYRNEDDKVIIALNDRLFCFFHCFVFRSFATNLWHS